MSDLQLHNDGVSFLELMNIFWRRKIVILLSSLICLSSTLIYLYYTKSSYDAKAYIEAPNAIDLSNINAAALHKTGDKVLKRYTIKSLYTRFTQNLLSEHIKRDFFNTIYFPYLIQTEGITAPEAAWNKFVYTFKIQFIESKLVYAITTESDSSEHSQNMIEDYLALTQKKTWNNIKKEVTNRINEKLISIEAEITFTKGLSHRYTTAQLNALHNALKESKFGQEVRFKNIELRPQSESFLLGENVLNVRIKNLEKEQINPELMSTFNNLQADKEFYSSIRISDADEINLYQLDGPILTSSIPVKPKRSLLLLLGGVLGVILGCFGAIVVDKFKHFKLTSYAVGRA